MVAMGRARRAPCGAWFNRVTFSLLIGLLLTTVAAQAATYVYDANGRLRAVTSSTGDSSEYIYDSLGNLYAIESVPSSQLAIFAFTPNHGPSGQLVTIAGQGFSSTPANNTVMFNGVAAVVSSASVRQLIATVPVGATTGPVSVQVGSNLATSVDDFVVTSDAGGLPPTITSFTPLIANAGSTISVTGSHFLTTAGATLAGVNVHATAVTPVSDTQLNFTVPGQVGSGFVTVTTPYGLAQSNALLVIPPNSVSASSVLMTAALAVDGAAQPFTINQVNRYAIATFQASAGQWLSLQFSQYPTTPSGNTVTVGVYNRDNVLIVNNGSISTGNLSFHLPQLSAGTYTVVLGSGSVTDQFSLALESAKVLNVDGASTSIPTTIAGQSKRLVFSANAGENLGLAISNLVLTNSDSGYVLTNVYKPDGGPWVWTNSCSPSACNVALSNAPETGTYSVVLQPPSADSDLTMGYTATVSHDRVVPLTANVTSAISLNAGQNGRFTFTGTIGSSYGLQVAGIGTTPGGKTVALSVLKPDGTTLATASAIAGYTFNLANLPSTGTYALVAQIPTFAATNLQVTLIPSASAAVAIDGASNNQPTTLAGQFAYFAFTANAGGYIGVGISNLVLTNYTTSNVKVSVYNPDGTLLASNAGCSPSGCTVVLANTPQTGVYGVVVAPATNDVTVKMSFTATVSHDLFVPLTANTTSSTGLKSGQSGRFTFAGTAGTTVGMQVAGISTTPSAKPVTLMMFSGPTLMTSVTATAGYTFNLANLPTTGTYTLYVQTASGAATNLQVTLIPSASAAVTVDGGSNNQPTTLAGQSAYFDFTANAGQQVGVGISSLVLTNYMTAYVNVSVYNPDGTLLASNTCSPSGCAVILWNILQSGVHGVVVTPATNDVTAKMSFTATVSHDLVVPLTANTTSSASLRSGQTGRFTFAGTAGTSVGLQVAGISTTPSAKPVTLMVYLGSTQIATATATAGNTFNLANLPTTGTYTLLVQTASGAATNLQVTLIPSASAAVTVDGASNNQPTTLAGQSVYFDFNATTGDNLGIGISNLVLTSYTFNYVVVNVYKPDGSLLISNGTCSPGSCDINWANAPQTGVYGVVVTPAVNDVTAKMSFTATVSHDVVASLTSGVGYNLNLSRPGQNAWLVSAGTAGANLTLQITSISSAQPIKFIVYKPNWTQLTTGQSSSSSYTFNLTNLPTTGNYTLYVDPSSGATATMTVTAH